MRFPRLCQERRASPPPWGSCRPQAFCSPFECVPAIGRRRAFLSECRTFISSLPRVPIAAFCVRSRLLFAALRQTGRLAVSCVPVPPGRDRHLCVLVMSARLSAFAGSLRVWPFLCGDPDGVARGRGGRRTENGAGGAAFVPLCVVILVLKFFPRGVRWGLRAPKPAPKSLRLSGLSSFNSRRGCVKHSRGQRVIQAAASLFRFASRFLCRTTIESGIRSGACGSGRLMMKYLSSSMA